jgi:hypothetical protein
MLVAGISNPLHISSTAVKLEVILENNDIVNGEKYSVCLIAWTQNGSNKHIERLYKEIKFGHVNLL